MKAEEEPIIVEQVYKTSVSHLWNAITQGDQMVQWFFDNIPGFKPEVGFETKFNIQVEDRLFPHVWKVTEVIPGKKIAYAWNFEGYEGKGLSTFELGQQEDMAFLKLTYEVHESFPDHIPEFKRESGVQGWNYFIKESLKAYLEKE